MCVKIPSPLEGPHKEVTPLGYHGDERRKRRGIQGGSWKRCLPSAASCLQNVVVDVSLPSAFRRRHVPRHLPRVFPHGVSQPGEAETTERALPPLLQVVRPEEAGGGGPRCSAQEETFTGEWKRRKSRRVAVVLRSLFYFEMRICWPFPLRRSNKIKACVVFFCTFVR